MTVRIVTGPEDAAASTAAAQRTSNVGKVAADRARSDDMMIAGGIRHVVGARIDVWRPVITLTAGARS